MQNALEVTFRGMTPSPAVQAAIEEWVGRLEHTHGRIQHCAVVVAQPHQHRRHGKLFHVHVDVTFPGGDIAVSREPARSSEHENVYVAVADAFRAARRQLRERTRSSRRRQVTRSAA
jgi:ribosome-associated translation inhibitor RaiA